MVFIQQITGNAGFARTGRRCNDDNFLLVIDGHLNEDVAAKVGRTVHLFTCSQFTGNNF